MTIDDPVRRALEALAADDGSRHARPHVGRAVLDAFDRQAMGRPRTLTVVAQLATAAAIIILGMATAMYVYTRRAPTPASLLETGTIALPAPVPERAHEETAMVDGRRASDALSPRPVFAERPAHTAPNRPAVLLASDGGDTFTQAFEARVPRAYLPLLGVPIIDPDAGGMIDIEFVLSEEGHTQAIRVLP